MLNMSEHTQPVASPGIDATCDLPGTPPSSLAAPVPDAVDARPEVEGETVSRLAFTPAALELIDRLWKLHGPLMFHQSGGCCDGSAPMCYQAGEFRTGGQDVLLGTLELPALAGMAGVGAGTGAQAGLAAGVGLAAGAGLGAGAEAGLVSGLGAGTEAELAPGVGAGTGAAGGMGVEPGAGAGAGGGTGAGVAAGAGTGAGTEARVDAGTGAGAGAGAGVQAGLEPGVASAPAVATAAGRESVSREIPFWMSREQFRVWSHTHLTIDAVPGRGGGFSLEAPEGLRFLIRSRLL